MNLYRRLSSRRADLEVGGTPGSWKQAGEWKQKARLTADS
jgi:hypothetical protein